MIAIADSGSTKTDWRIVDGETFPNGFESAGYNPHVVDSGFVQTNIIDHPELCDILKECTELHFYGAGLYL